LSYTRIAVERLAFPSASFGQSIAFHDGFSSDAVSIAGTAPVGKRYAITPAGPTGENLGGAPVPSPRLT